MKKYDVIVIGSGPGGSSLATKCAAEGKSVAVADALFGGTCALKGCTPKKAMESVTSMYWSAKEARGSGFAQKIVPIDWRELMAHKAKFTALVPSGTKANFRKNGIDILEGYASFLDKNTLSIGDKKYSAEKIVIATGSKPRPMDFEGADHMITSYGFFELDQLPKKIAIVGGGYIGFELSHIAAACGAQVTIISNAEQPLGAFDKTLVDGLVKATLEKGIEVKLGFSATKITKYNNTFTVVTERADGNTFDVSADLVIHAAGRVPAVDKLDLDNTKIELNDKNGIVVNDYLQVKGHSHIYALGDVTSHLPFTEVAIYEAGIVAHNICSNKKKKAEYKGVPMVVYTHPRLAMVGEKEVKKQSDYNIKEKDLSTAFTQRCKLNKFAYSKAIIHKKTKKIVGVQLLGYNMDEAINIYAMAIQLGVTKDQLEDLFFAYPTVSHGSKHWI